MKTKCSSIHGNPVEYFESFCADSASRLIFFARTVLCCVHGESWCRGEKVTSFRLAVPTATATLPHAVITLQCAAYFTDGKYRQILPSLQHEKQLVNKNRLSTRKWALNYRRTAGQGLTALFGFWWSWALTTLRCPQPQPPPQPQTFALRVVNIL